MPPATGKFSICMAKMKAATSPAIGTCRSSRLSAAFFTETAINPDRHHPADQRGRGVHEAVGDVHGASSRVVLRDDVLDNRCCGRDCSPVIEHPQMLNPDLPIGSDVPIIRYFAPADGRPTSPFRQVRHRPGRGLAHRSGRLPDATLGW